MKSHDFTDGFTAALVYVSDLFESHADALIEKKLMRKRQIKLVVSIIDACIRRRETLADVGPKKMNLFVRPDGRADLKEK